MVARDAAAINNLFAADDLNMHVTNSVNGFNIHDISLKSLMPQQEINDEIIYAFTLIMCEYAYTRKTKHTSYHSMYILCIGGS